ncbi:hypothetical protein HTZ84_04345 [Haloterrigena sp. SYSU A558-1]|uniref:Uncharacterized protein n=1 Tax=Haloterrigena gelatinilytica TaxID=2741724 RepID=A0A8J8GMR0_9EURY|nr:MULTISPECIES: hypothetical protein [Haloterrigena]NUB92536.1 hypothetical protein [Haloterrigena gelatinilytica]NUC71547.1 hypothetical protein [Haloterrigena gelatinilytica]
MFGLEDALPPRVTKTTLYRVVGWGLRWYVLTVLVVGCYSLLWVLDLAGLVSESWLSTVWIAIAVMGTLFLVLLIPLFYTSRSSTR